MRESSVGPAAMLLAAVIAAGCTAATVSGGPPASPTDPSAESQASAAPTLPVTAAPGSASSSAPPRTAGPGVASPSTPAGSPPEATLEVPPGGATVPGDLGSYTWDGFASDGPWVVGTASNAATAGTWVGVSFAGDPAPGSWTAAWAPLRNGKPATPVAAGSGTGGIAVRVPAEPGQWSLRVVASFGEGRQAAWYWRLAVLP